MAPYGSAKKTWLEQRQQRAGSSREAYLTPPRRRQAPVLLRAPPAATSLFTSVILQRGHFLAGVHARNSIQCHQPLHGNAGTDNATKRHSNAWLGCSSRPMLPHDFLMACMPGRRLSACSPHHSALQKQPVAGRQTLCQAGLYTLIGSRTARRRHLVLVRGYGHTPHLQAPIAQHSGHLGLVCFQLLNGFLSIGLCDDADSGCMAAARDLRREGV